MHDVVMRMERDMRLYRAELRQLERETGQSASADGRYWLERTCALEHIVATAEHAIASGDLEPLRRDLLLLRAIRAPACNGHDHGG